MFFDRFSCPYRRLWKVQLRQAIARWPKPFAIFKAASPRLRSIAPRYQHGWKSAGRPTEFQLRSRAQAGKDLAPGSARFEAIASGWDTSASIEPSNRDPESAAMSGHGKRRIRRRSASVIASLPRGCGQGAAEQAARRAGRLPTSGKQGPTQAS
jgi:hypothetical protein